MIHITDKHNCCGCSACVQICPRQCISFDEDAEGFRYPLVNKELCIRCGLCEKVCPCLHPGTPRKPLKVFAAVNPDEEIRMKSSSGGIFSALAEAVIDEGGVVFGARFDEHWEVVHDYTETKEGLAAFRGSKYVQSHIGKTFQQARDFLKSGRKVLFSGTPCQIAGLKLSLRKEYENLLAVECVCHGVPSPLVWRDYLNEVVPADQKIKDINFRDKEKGWKNYGLRIDVDSCKKSIYVRKNKNPYMFAFLHNYSLRPSCFNCPARSGKSKSDITIGDFWGIDVKKPQYFNKNGVSLVIIRSQKGLEAFNPLQFNGGETTYQDALYENGSLEHSVNEPVDRASFWNLIQEKGFEATWPMLRKLEPTKFRRLLTKIRSKIRIVSGR